VRTPDSVKRAYRDLVASDASVDVQRQSLALSEELVRHGHGGRNGAGRRHPEQPDDLVVHDEDWRVARHLPKPGS